MQHFICEHVNNTVSSLRRKALSYTSLYSSSDCYAYYKYANKYSVDGCHKDNATLLFARPTFCITLLIMLNNMYVLILFSFQSHRNQQCSSKKAGTFYQLLKVHLYFHT